MSNAQAEGTVKEAEVDNLVANHLRDNPDFFERHETLLTSLSIPHSSGSAVSLVERQLQMLREESAQLRIRLRHLVEVARDNEQLSVRLQQVTLALMDATNLNDAVSALDERMREVFEASEVSLCFVIPQDSTIDVEGHTHLVREGDTSLGTIRPFLLATRPKCGRFKPAQLNYLFGETAREIRSAAIIPLTNSKGQGILAIASSDAKRFHPGMGTLFLAQLGELTSHALLSLLPDE